MLWFLYFRCKNKWLPYYTQGFCVYVSAVIGAIFFQLPNHGLKSWLWTQILANIEVFSVIKVKDRCILRNPDNMCEGKPCLSHLLALCLCGAWAGAPAIGLAPGPAQDQAGHVRLQGAGAGGAGAVGAGAVGAGAVGMERGGGFLQWLLQPQHHGAAALGDRAVKAHGSVWIVFLLCWTFGCSGLWCQGPTGGRGGVQRDLWREGKSWDSPVGNTKGEMLRCQLGDGCKILKIKYV